MTEIRGRLAWAAALLVFAALLSGCARMPTGGTVRSGEEVRSEERDPYVRVLPQPPEPGADQRAVVQGFLEAMASYEPGYTVARQYLTPEEQQAWDPFAGIVVYDGSSGFPVSQQPDGSVALTTTQLATIDDRGSYDAAIPGAPITVDFPMEQVDGEWRISEVDDGLLVSNFDLSREYGYVNLYFLDPGGTRLVPDPVFLPLRSGLATTTVESLLAGPTSWLAPSVATAFPEGTRLTGPVTVEDGVAGVDLTRDVLAASADDREGLSAQLVWTLRQLPDVSAVRITAEGFPLDVPGAPAEQSTQPPLWSNFDPDVIPAEAPAYFIDGRERLVTFEEGNVTPAPGPLGEGAVPLRTIGVSLDYQQAAVVSPDGHTLSVGPLGGPDPPTPVYQGTDLSAPSWGPDGRVWVVDRRSKGPRVMTVDAAGDVQEVTVDKGLGDRWVGELRVSRDGTRVAAVVGRDDDSRLLVGRVENGGQTVSRLRAVATELVEVLDVSWADAGNVVVLGREERTPLQPYAVRVDGSDVVAGSSLQGIRTLAAAPEGNLLAGSDDGKVWRHRGTGTWEAVAEGMQPVYPG